MSDTKKNNLNVEADVTMIISVHTGGAPDEIRDASVEEVLNDGELLTEASKSIYGCQEVMDAMAELVTAAARHRAKYPDTRITMSPAISILEPKDI